MAKCINEITCSVVRCYCLEIAPDVCKNYDFSFWPTILVEWKNALCLQEDQKTNNQIYKRDTFKVSHFSVLPVISHDVPIFPFSARPPFSTLSGLSVFSLKFVRLISFSLIFFLLVPRRDKYNVFEHNCNAFSNEVAQFLTGKKIPSYITDLPSEVLSTWVPSI